MRQHFQWAGPVDTQPFNEPVSARSQTSLKPSPTVADRAAEEHLSQSTLRIRYGPTRLRLLRPILASEESRRKLCCIAPPPFRRPGLLLSRAQVWLHHLAIEVPRRVPEHRHYHGEADGVAEAEMRQVEGGGADYFPHLALVNGRICKTDTTHPLPSASQCLRPCTDKPPPQPAMRKAPHQQNQCVLKHRQPRQPHREPPLLPAGSANFAQMQGERPRPMQP